jgi:hypothetical protein
MLPGSYDMVSEPQEPAAETVIVDEQQEEIAENIPTESEKDVAEEILAEVTKMLAEKERTLTPADEETIRKIVREEIKEALKTEFLQKKKSQVVIPPNTSEKDKEDYLEADLQVANTPPKPKKDAKQQETKPKYILYLYSMDGCSPCNKAYDELIKESGHIFELYVGKYPTTFRDGTPVANYPSYELWKDGLCKKKWAGYTPINTIIDACNE